MRDFQTTKLLFHTPNFNAKPHIYNVQCTLYVCRMYYAAGICGFVMHSWTALDISICIKTIATRFSMGWKIGSRYISKMNSNFSRKINYSKSFDWLANIYLSSKMHTHTHTSIGIDTDIPLECLLFAFEKSDKQSSANRLNRIILNWRTFCKSTNSVYRLCA